jgi:hypothetical protein
MEGAVRLCPKFIGIGVTNPISAASSYSSSLSSSTSPSLSSSLSSSLSRTDLKATNLPCISSLGDSTFDSPLLLSSSFLRSVISPAQVANVLALSSEVLFPSSFSGLSWLSISPIALSSLAEISSSPVNGSCSTPTASPPLTESSTSSRSPSPFLLLGACWASSSSLWLFSLSAPVSTLAVATHISGRKASIR